MDAEVLEKLRYRFEGAEGLTGRPVAFDHDTQRLQSRRQPNAGHDDVARLLAAKVEAVGAHLMEHVAVFDLGADQREVALAQRCP